MTGAAHCVRPAGCASQDPDGFCADAEAEQEALRARIRKAQQALPNIKITPEVRSFSKLLAVSCMLPDLVDRPQFVRIHHTCSGSFCGTTQELLVTIWCL